MKITLKNLIGFLLYLHSGFSLIRIRKHEVARGNTTFEIPLDVILEILIAFLINMTVGILSDKKFLNIHEFPNEKSYQFNYKYGPDFQHCQFSACQPWQRLGSISRTQTPIGQLGFKMKSYSHKSPYHFME